MIGAILVGLFIALVLILIAIIMTCITSGIVMIIIKIYDLITIKSIKRTSNKIIKMRENEDLDKEK